MLKYHKKTEKGFTLIELLVVISIIGLLSSIILSSLNGARLRGRIAKRLSDMHQVQIALELYYSANGSYPNSATWRSQCPTWGSFSASNVIPGLVPTYLPSFPSDPMMVIAIDLSCYIYRSDGTDYVFLDHNVPELEGSAPNYASYSVFVDPTRDGGSNACTVDGASFWSWKVSSPGGACW